MVKAGSGVRKTIRNLKVGFQLLKQCRRIKIYERDGIGAIRTIKGMRGDICLS